MYLFVVSLGISFRAEVFHAGHTSRTIDHAFVKGIWDHSFEIVALYLNEEKKIEQFSMRKSVWRISISTKTLTFVSLPCRKYECFTKSFDVLNGW